LREGELSAFVQRVARSEQIALHPGALESIVKRSHGDVRAALNDLDAIAPLPPGPWQLTVLGFRDLAADFVALTEEALTTPRYYRSVEVQDRLDAPPDDLLPWIEENLPMFAPDAGHRDAAFRVLAVADQFLARARRARRREERGRVLPGVPRRYGTLPRPARHPGFAREEGRTPVPFVHRQEPGGRAAVPRADLLRRFRPREPRRGPTACRRDRPRARAHSRGGGVPPRNGARFPSG